MTRGTSDPSGATPMNPACQQQELVCLRNIQIFNLHSK